VKTRTYRFDGDWLVVTRDGMWLLCGTPWRALRCWWRER
jgi:hypothetical protein